MNLAMIDALLNRESGYVNDPSDAGGETNFGITVAVARAQGYNGEMKDMPRVFAQSVYLHKYYQDPGFDKICTIFPALADKMFDIGVNRGVDVPIRYVQRALISLGYSSTETGVWGNNDPVCLQAFLDKRGVEGQRVLIFMVSGQQSTDYIHLALKSPAQEKFEYGWQLNRSLYKVEI